MSRASRLAALALAPLLLAGCAGSGDDLRADVAALTGAVNARDADAVRLRADELKAGVEARAAAGELDPERAQRLVALAESVRRGADVLDADLLEQRRLEAETEAERKRLEQERQRLEQERAAAEAARRATEEREQDDDGKGKGKGGGKDD
jgi:hypothetical protein